MLVSLVFSYRPNSKLGNTLHILSQKILELTENFREITAILLRKWNFGKNYRYFVAKIICWLKIITISIAEIECSWK